MKPDMRASADDINDSKATETPADTSTENKSETPTETSGDGGSAAGGEVPPGA